MDVNDARSLLRKLGVRESRILEDEERNKFLFWLELANPQPYQENWYLTRKTGQENVGLHNWEFYYNFDGVEYRVVHSGDHYNEIVVVEELGPYV